MGRSYPPGNLWCRCFLVGHVADSAEQRENAPNHPETFPCTLYIVEVQGRCSLQPLFLNHGGIVCRNEVILECFITSTVPLFGFFNGFIHKLRVSSISNSFVQCCFVETWQFEICFFLEIRCCEMTEPGPVTRI